MNNLQRMLYAMFAAMMDAAAMIGRSTDMDPDSVRQYQLEADDWQWRADKIKLTIR